jgi:hypothetical protein
MALHGSMIICGEMDCSLQAGHHSLFLIGPF